MATIKSFEDLVVWQHARDLAHEIYNATSNGTFAKDYELKNQINRSSGSIMDNIAEGFERDGNKEFKQFLSIAKGSTGEVRSQLYRALDRKHLTATEFETLKTKALKISKQLSSFGAYLNNTDKKGLKYVEEPPESYYNYLIEYSDIGTLEPIPNADPEAFNPWS